MYCVICYQHTLQVPCGFCQKCKSWQVHWWELVKSSTVMAGSPIIRYHKLIRANIWVCWLQVFVLIRNFAYGFHHQNRSNSFEYFVRRLGPWCLDTSMSHCDALIAASCWYLHYHYHINEESDHYMRIELLLSDPEVELLLSSGPNLVVINYSAQCACPCLN